MQLTELQLNRYLYKTQPQTLETQSADSLSSNINPAPSTAVASGNTVIDINTNSMTINGGQLTPGTIPASTLDIAVWGWTQTCAFTVTDADTVAWGAGTFKSADGVLVYSINAGNTGNMAAKTYVYLDIAISTTQYQLSTNILDPIGIGKVLIAVCENGAATATYNLVQATQIVSDNILANSINANRIVAGSITATQLSTTILYAGTITLDTNGQIKGGMSGYNSGAGFFLGMSGGIYKFSVGDSAGSKMLWDGSTLSIVGSISSTSSGQRVVISGTSAGYYNASGVLIAHTIADSNSFLIAGDQSNSNIIFDAGTTGIIGFLSNGSPKIYFDNSNTTFYPATDGGLDLGDASFRWSTIYGYAANIADKMYYTANQIVQPLIYTGKISGTTISQHNTVGWTVGHPSTGIYVITHNLANTNYNIQITAQATTAKIWSMYNHGSNSVYVRIADYTGTLEDNDFAFQLALNL